MQTATDSKAEELERARERLAQAKAAYDRAEEEVNGPARRLAAAWKSYYDAQALVADLTQTRTIGGKNVL